MSVSPLIPAALMAEVEALARAQDRAAPEMVREAIEDYIRERKRRLSADSHPQAARDLREIGARILKRREGNALPEGMSIRDLQDCGRA